MANIWRALAVLMGALWLNPALADEVGDASQSVVRIIAVVDGPYGLEAGTGTGFAISPTRIVTNAHVVERVYNSSGRSGIGIVPFNTGKRIVARIVAYDPNKDLAVLEVDGARFTPLKLFGGTFKDGTDVVALGYPGNVDRLTDASVIEPQAAVRAGGNFSNMSEIRGVDVMLHTAQIAHGNSGGPLVDSCGRVLGVNTYVTENNQGDSSFGFAVSGSELRAFLKRNGQTFGVTESECVPPEVAEARKIAAAAKAEQDKTRADLNARAAQDQQRAAHLARLHDERDNRMAIAAMVLVMAALAGAYALIAGSKQDSENPKPWPARLGWGASALLAVGAMAAFLTRPSLSEPMPVSPYGTEATAADAAVDASAAAMDAAPADKAMKK